MKSRNIHRFSDKTWVIEGTAGGAVVQFAVGGSYERRFGAGIERTIQRGGKSYQYFSWGPSDDLPVARQKLVTENNIVPQIMRTARNILIGQGMFLFEKRIDKEGNTKIVELTPPQSAKDFLEFTDFELTVLPALARDLIMNSTMLCEFVRTKGGQIYSVEAKECAHSRSGLKDQKGKVKEWYWNGAFGNPSKILNFETQVMPLYDRNLVQSKFLKVYGDSLFHDDFYNIPVWEGSKNWIELANLIPLFHTHNLNNGFTPRWHIEIPWNYFVDTKKYPDIDALDDDEYKAFVLEETALREAFMKKINSVLSGVQGAGNAIFTEFEVSEALAKELPGIKIKALSSELNHEAFMKLFDATNIANISAHGLPPVVASIQTAGRISAGAEMRNSLWLYVIVNTPLYRKMLSSILNFIHKANGWGAGEWGFKDIEITKLDENKTGQQVGSMS